MTTDEKIEEETGGVISISGQNDDEIYLYSILPKNFISEHGLLDIAVVGQIAENKKNAENNLVVDSFQPNPDFVYMLHEFLDKFGRNAQFLLKQLPKQAEGTWLYLVDQRVDDTNASISPEDIVGGYMIKDGQLGEYAGNPSHELLTKKGIFQLGVELKSELINYIKFNYDQKQNDRQKH